MRAPVAMRKADELHKMCTTDRWTPFLASRHDFENLPIENAGPSDTDSTTTSEAV